MTKKPLLTRQLDGFSLTEVSIALIIMGILIGGALKGRQLIRSARLNATTVQLKSTEMELSQYRDAFGTLPGVHPDGSIPDQKDVWITLARQSHRETPPTDMPTTKIGGVLKVEKDPLGLDGHWLVLSKDTHHSGLLTPHEAKSLLSKYDEVSPSEGHVRVLNGTSASTCLKGDTLNLDETKPVCVVALDLS